MLETHVDNMATLTGVAKDETGLSTFTGSTISDGATIKKNALQDLETAVEGACKLVLLLQTVLYARLKLVVLTLLTYLTFVADDNNSATGETVYTDCWCYLQPFLRSNLLTVGTAELTHHPPPWVVSLL